MSKKSTTLITNKQLNYKVEIPPRLGNTGLETVM